MGKRQISQLTFFDYVVGITIGSIAATLSVEMENELAHAMIGLLVWTVFPVALGYLSLRSRWFRKLVDGDPAVMVKEGEIMEDNLRRERYSLDNLLMQLREAGVFNLKDVEVALLEPNGKLSVNKKAEKQAVTMGDLHLSADYQGLPMSLVKDGEIIREGLVQMGVTESWLRRRLVEMGIDDVGGLSLVHADSGGDLYVDGKDVPSQYKDGVKRDWLLWSELDEMVGDFERLAQGEREEDLQSLYRRGGNRVKAVRDGFGTYVNDKQGGREG